MRKSGLIILVVLALLAGLGYYFTRDHYLERALEYQIEQFAEARVEIDNFHFSIFGLKCGWDRVQIANKRDPWRNILETDKASFAIEARPLFWRKVIIHEMILENVRSGSARKTEGTLPYQIDAEPGIVGEVFDSVQKQISALPLFDLSGLGQKLDLDSLVNVNNLASVQSYQNLRGFADSSYSSWKSGFDPQSYVKRAEEIKTEVASLNIDQVKDAAALISTLDKLKGIQTKANTLKEDVETKKKTLESTVAAVQAQAQSAQNSLKEDIERVQRLAKLQDIDTRQLSLLLFGAPAVQRVEQVLDYIALGRKYLPMAQAAMTSSKLEAPPRFKGQDIHFPFHYRYPRFLAREIKLSGATAGGDTSRAYFLSGEIKNLTNQPTVAGLPTQFNLDFLRVDGNQYTMSGSFDHTTEVGKDSLWIAANNFALGQIKLPDNKHLPHALAAQKGDVALSGFFVGDALDLRVNVKAAPVSFDFSTTPKDFVSNVVQDVLAGFTQLELGVQLQGERSNYGLSIHSNLDNVLADQLKKVVGEKLAEARMQIETRVRAEVDKRRKEAEALVENYKQNLTAEMQKARGAVDQQLEELNKRKAEVEARIEAEKNKGKQAVEEEAKKKLRGLLKKP
jgi:uncharacterized protein (TIGR03545 family)